MPNEYSKKLAEWKVYLTDNNALYCNEGCDDGEYMLGGITARRVTMGDIQSAIRYHARAIHGINIIE